METKERESFAEWCVLELMGHRRLAGFVRETEIAGSGVLRIDIPSEPPVTQFYPPSAIYCLTPTTEAIARALAKRVTAEPVSRYELPPAKSMWPSCSDCEREIEVGEPVTLLAGGGFRCRECQDAMIKRTADTTGDPERIF